MPYITCKKGGTTTSLWNVEEWSIVDSFGPSGDKANILFPTLLYPDNVVEGDDIEILFGTFTIFHGYAIEVVKQRSDSQAFEARVACEDYTRFLDAKLINDVFLDTTAGAMVASALLAGTNRNAVVITSAGVSHSAPVLPKSVDLQAVSEFLQSLADEVGAVWYVDFNRDLVFKPLWDTSFKAPITDLNLDSSFLVGDVVINRSVANIVNTLLVREFAFKGQNLVYDPGDTTRAGRGAFVGDGSTCTFRLAYSPYSLNEMSVTVGGAAKTIRTESLDGIPGSAGGDASLVFVDFENATIRFDDAPVSSAQIEVTYRPRLKQPFTSVFHDIWSIMYFKNLENRAGRVSDGIYEKSMSFQEAEYLMTTGNDPFLALQAIAEAKFQRYAWPLVTGTFRIRSSDTPLDPSGNVQIWRAGQYFRISGTQWNLYDLKTWMKSGVKLSLPVWVTQVNISPETPTELLYEVHFSTAARPE